MPPDRGKVRNKEDNTAFYSQILVDLVHFRLCLTMLNNVLTWDRATLVADLLLGYEIDFVMLIKLEIHERAFDETTTHPFYSFIQ